MIVLSGEQPRGRPREGRPETIRRNKEQTMRKNRPDIQPLQLVPRFRGANRRSLEALAPHTDVVRLPAGRVVVESGRTAHEFLVLVQGEAVEIGHEGEAVEIGDPGEALEIGADAVRRGEPHPRTIVTRTDATFVVIEGRAFRGADRLAS
jgi:hypothetical protein